MLQKPLSQKEIPLKCRLRKCLQKQMKILAGSMKQISRSITDPSKQTENIALVEAMIKAATDAAEINPPKAQSIAASDHEGFIADYRALLRKLKDALSELDGALKTNQYEQAKALLEKIGSIKTEGHSQFREE